MKQARQAVRFPGSRLGESRPTKAVIVGDRLYTCAQAAELTGTTERFWRELIAQRRVRYVKIGKFVRIPESAINELLAQGTVEPSS
jgi:excisionase family DNA binding protein